MLGPGLLPRAPRRFWQPRYRQKPNTWMAQRRDLRDEHGYRLVVANGFLPERQVMTGVGSVPIRQPRIEDRRPADQREKLNRRIRPPYLRRTSSMDEAIPWMDLYGISAHDVGDSLKALLGPALKHLSPSTVSRLVSQWQDAIWPLESAFSGG